MGLDAKQAASKLLGEGQTVGVAILGPDGKVLWKGSDPFKGAFFYPGPGNPPVPFVDLQRAIEPHLDKGLLGGLKVPKAAEPVAKQIRTGNLATAQLMLAGLKGDPDVMSFKDVLLERLEKLRAEKRALFDGLVAAEKSWDAYKVGTSYVKSWPKASDLAEVKEALKKLQSAPAVKDNLAAKAAFSQVAATGFGSRSKASASAQASASMAQIAEKYGATEYGKLAALLK
ncbi:MAG TPA: hypothetical protein VEJ18_14885 [Planctomycetota bacterium]|nr:hypothetical protein [Planctomycetota bacterium]